MEVRWGLDAVVLVLQGELDLSGAPRLAGALDAAVAAGHERIVLEARRLTFIDCMSLGLIERTRRHLRTRGGELTVRHPQRPVRRAIELCARFSGLGECLDRAPASIGGTRVGGAAVAR